jgi:predicted ATP-dependent endonuclease of OLD family
MLEGKNDFYVLSLVTNLLARLQQEYKIVPGMGAGGLDDLIRLHIAWGMDFVVLLDSDAGGRREKKRYVDRFGATVDGHVFSYSDIDNAWGDLGMEKFFRPDERLTIQKLCYPDSEKYNKTHFNRAIQELFLTHKHVPLSEETQSKFEKIFDFISSNFSERSQ